MYICRMKLPLYILLALVVVCLGHGCRPSAFDADVARAEALMESDPDSALAIAGSLRPSGEGQEARAALALLKARYKAYVPLTDDSLALFSADYFTADDTLAAQANFFLGETYFNLNRYDRALLAAKTGQDIADRIGDNYYAGLLARLQADIYHNTYDIDNELKYRLEAIHDFICAGKNGHVLWDKLEYAQILASSGKMNKSLSLIDSIEDDAVASGPGMRMKLIRTKAINYYRLHRYEDIMKLYAESENLNTFKTSYDWWLEAVALAYLGKPQKAEQAIALAWNLSYDMTDTVRAFSAQRIIAEMQNDYESAYRTFLIEDSLTLSYMDSALTHPYNALIAETYHLQADIKAKEAEKAIVALYLSIAIFILCLIIAFLIISLLRNKIRLNVTRIDNLLDKLRGLESSGASNSNKIDKLSRDNIVLTEHHLEEINLICTEIYKIPSHAKETKHVLKKFESFIDGFKNNTMLGVIEEFLDKKYEGVMRLLRTEVCGLSEKQIAIFTYCALGFTPEAATLLTSSTSVNAFNAAKSRLKSAILKSDPEHADLFVSLLSTYKKGL